KRTLEDLACDVLAVGAGVDPVGHVRIHTLDQQLRVAQRIGIHYLLASAATCCSSALIEGSGRFSAPARASARRLSRPLVTFESASHVSQSPSSCLSARWRSLRACGWSPAS